MSKNVVVIGTQWGDEGKGKIVDWLTDHAHAVVRFQGGHNAGHTLVIGQGEGGSHEIESSAYELGKVLTEKLQLPNLKDKGKKASLTMYTYDLVDR